MLIVRIDLARRKWKVKFQQNYLLWLRDFFLQKIKPFWFMLLLILQRMVVGAKCSGKLYIPSVIKTMIMLWHTTWVLCALAYFDRTLRPKLAVLSLLSLLLYKLQKFSVLLWRPNLPKIKKVHASFEFYSTTYLVYITLVFTCIATMQ